ncbi:MAG: hypothetical protein ABW352_09850 [Polyangiales bacterium]
MSELSSDAKALIERTRLDDTPRDEDKQRIRGRLAAQLGVGAFAGATLVASTAGVAPVASHSGWFVKSTLMRWLAGTVAAGSVAVGGFLLTSPSAKRVAPPAVVTAPIVEPPAIVEPAVVEPAVVEPAVVEPTVVEPAVEEAPVARAPSRKRRAPAPTIAPVGNSSTMNAEIALLAQAQQALRARDGKQALRLAQQHAANFPGGALYEERVGIEAIAHCVLGEREHPAVRAFLARSPRSPLGARVRKECGLP